MFSIVFIITVTVLIALYEVPFLLKNKLIKELIVFFIFLICAFILSVLTSLHIKIPNPMDMLTKIFKVFNDLLEKI